MKKYLFLFAACLAAVQCFAQLNIRDLPVVYLPDNVSVHFVSPEPIRYVDISIKNIIGDLPVSNILRIRQRDSLNNLTDAIVTITGEKFIAQYRVLPCPEDREGAVQTEIPVLPADTRPLENPEVSLSQPELKANALRLLAIKANKSIEKVTAFGLTGQLYHIYTVGDYIFLDLGYKNTTRLRYDIDQLKFAIEDKKVTKASTVQSVAVDPLLILQPVTTFEKHYRNIFVFKKLTFPGNKVFSIELSEKQLSGRALTIKVRYEDLLAADAMPF